MKFSNIVKIGGHTFNLLQNKDLLELFGMAKNGFSKLKEQQKNVAAPPAVIPPVQIPAQYPVPIDSPYWGQPPLPPYGYFPAPGGWNGNPVARYPQPYPFQNRQGTLVSARKSSRPKNKYQR